MSMPAPRSTDAAVGWLVALDVDGTILHEDESIDPFGVFECEVSCDDPTERQTDNCRAINLEELQQGAQVFNVRKRL